MGTYRVYRLDGLGRICGVEWLNALDDAYALEGARAIAEAGGCPRGCEVWQLGRKVGWVPSPVAVAVAYSSRPRCG